MKKLQKFLALTVCIAILLGILAYPAHASNDTSGVSEEILTIQQIYPEGTVCTNTTPEFRINAHGPCYIMAAQGCWGFAVKFVAEYYGYDLKQSIPATWLEINKSVSSQYPKAAYTTARESVQIGDILAVVNPGHAMVVISMDETGVTIGEGNYGGHVHYGRRLSYEAIDQNVAYIFRITPPVRDGSVHENCPCHRFSDMPAFGTPEHEAIDWAFTHKPQKLTAGTSGTTFSPAETVTRAQALTFLWKAFGEPEPITRACPFKDVKMGSYYYKAVLWAVENGVTAGTSAVTFSPNQTCNRSEILTFIYRALGSPVCNCGNPFSDVMDGKWYARTAAWAYDNCIEVGAQGAFCPKTACTRASTILYIYRALEHKALAAAVP